MKNNFTLTRKTLSIFWQHARKYPRHLTVIGVGVLLWEGFQTYIPLLYRDLINILAGATDKGQAASAAIHLILVILVLNMIQNVTWRIGLFVNNYFQPKVMFDLVNTCYEYLQRHSYGFFTSKFVGSLVTKVKRFERSFEVIADQFIFNLGRSILDALLIISVLLWQYPKFGLILLGWSFVFVIVSTILSMIKLPYDIQKASADTNMTAQLADTLTNNLNVKLFTNFFRETEAFRKVTHKQFLLRKKSNDFRVWAFFFQALLSIGLEFLFMYLAIQYWKQGLLAVGDLALFQAYIFRVFVKLWEVGENIQKIYEAIADGNEMTEILATPHEVQDAPGSRSLAIRKGSIEFRDVSFGYFEESKVLEHFNLKITPGEKVALIGPSGGGKSTIVKLLFRFQDVQDGSITIDKQDIAGVTQDSLRKALALVPQEPILFHRSIMDNIRYARMEASDEEVIEAAKLAHAHDFIMSFNEGYKTLVGERGVKLSGGERQRVAIARAILKDAPILVMDEATSSLDSESEMYIQDALTKLMSGRTTIVVAHRLSTIMQMDRIVVIENGAIVEQGKHQELLKVKKGVYQKLWDIQAGGFALSKVGK